MNTSLLLIIPLAGFAVSALLATVSRRTMGIGKAVAIAGFTVVAIVAMAARQEINFTVTGSAIPGWTIQFGLTNLSWYFVLMIAAITWLTTFFSLGALRDGKTYPMFYAWLFAKTFGMIGVLLARDLLTFFILWEIMSWATYFLMQQGTDTARRASTSYLVYAIAASMILFAGVIFLYRASGSYDFTRVAATVAGFETGTLITTVVLLLVPMLIESAVYPAHWWLPPAYANTETGITAYLAGISTRIGVYGVVIFLFTVFGPGTMAKLSVGYHLNLQVIIMALAAFTMVVPTFTALFQHDAKQLMTWHSIGQGGYMLMGIATASSLGVAGGLFHVFNHMAYVSLIVFSIAAVEYRTGTTNLNSLGGLIKKQPVAFLGLLFGIIGLAGIPPMNGFVSKWLVYRSLILGGYPFLALAAFIATLGTILSVYKLIHNMFLGQLPERYNEVKEVGFLMQLPIWILMATVLVTGIFPGLILGWVAQIQISLGLEPIAYTLTGVSPTVGQLNMGVITSVFAATFVLAALIFFAGGRRRHVSQYNNYAAGHFVTKEVKYNFNYNFYSAFDHIFEHRFHNPPVKRGEGALVALLERASEFARRIYTGRLNTYLAYSLAAVVLAVVILKEVL